MDDAVNLVMTLIVAGMIVGAGLLALSSLIGTDAYWDTLSATNETGNFADSGYTDLAQDNLVTNSETVYNTTAQTLVLTNGNYTMNYTDGGILMDNANYNGWTQSIDYNYKNETTEYLSTEKAQTGVVNFSEMLPTVGTMIGIAVLLFVVGVAFTYFKGWY